MKPEEELKRISIGCDTCRVKMCKVCPLGQRKDKLRELMGKKKKTPLELLRDLFKR